MDRKVTEVDRRGTQSESHNLIQIQEIRECKYFPACRHTFLWLFRTFKVKQRYQPFLLSSSPDKHCTSANTLPYTRINEATVSRMFTVTSCIIYTISVIISDTIHGYKLEVIPLFAISNGSGK